MKNSSEDLINKLAEAFSAKTYLEIGVRRGETFFNVHIPHKTAVDPNFMFDIHDHEEKEITYFPITSDAFFEQFESVQKNTPYNATDKNFTFDIIFIDGLHTYEQSKQDFIHSINYSHDKTIWILDDTVPWDPFSAHPNQTVSLKYRAMLNISGYPWHGDVFKTVAYIHEFRHDFSYATHINNGNPQTIIWKTKHSALRKDYGGVSFVEKMTVFDLYENAEILNPINIEELDSLIFRQIDDSDFCYTEPQKIIRPLTSFRELEYRKQLSILDSRFRESFLVETDKINASIQDIYNFLHAIKFDKYNDIEKRIEEQTNAISAINKQLSSIKEDTDLFETKRRNIVRHIKETKIQIFIFIIISLIIIIAFKLF